MKKVIVIGGGAAGMMSAIVLAEKGYNVTLIEQNDKLGKKLFITGKGRCNITNNSDVDTLLKNVVTNSKFMYSAFNCFDSSDTLDFFEGLGLKVKTERGNRVFPVSDHSSDVINVLFTKLKRLGVQIMLNTKALGIETGNIDDDSFFEKEESQKTKYNRYVKGINIVLQNGKKEFINTDYVVVATGGVSYPSTGSTGDGIRWAKDLMLKVTDPRPALVPVCIKESICKDLMGLSLKNIQASFVAKIKNKTKVIYTEFGEMIFTHFGVSGPVILSGSSYIGKYIDDNLKLILDFKPALTGEQLDQRLLRDFGENINKQFRNSLGELLPKKLIPVVIEKSGIDQYKKVNEISKEERGRLVYTLKNFELTVTGVRDFNEAIITQGGVSVKEVDPKTMESKQIKGLNFVGEVLDVDALTGGFNLQIAWSTAAMLK